MEIHSKDSSQDAEGCPVIGQTIKGIRLFFAWTGKDSRVQFLLPSHILRVIMRREIRRIYIVLRHSPYVKIKRQHAMQKATLDGTKLCFRKGLQTCGRLLCYLKPTFFPLIRYFKCMVLFSFHFKGEKRIFSSLI